MTQNQALAILDAGHSVFLTGPAGSGKTFVLNRFIREARDDGKSVAVTATTGLAATHLNGMTIHSWAGIGVADELNERHLEKMPKTRRASIEKADILVIDEVSMLHDFRLDMIDQAMRIIREDDQPFGGLQVVMSGDLFQLPPINRADSRQGGFVVDSEVWRDLEPIVCYLEEQHRQEDSDDLHDILTALRSNDLRRRHADTLLAKRSESSKPKDITELYTTNVDVDFINQQRLDELPGEARSFFMNSSGKKAAIGALKKSTLAQEELQLKKGALVMFIKNSTEQRAKYVNGTMGEVVGFEDETSNGYPIVRLQNGQEITATPDTWEMLDGEKVVAELAQIPLKLAWAITIHKSQGMTLDAAHIDLSRAFVPGMGYVALSRLRSLDSLSLEGLNRIALTMHEQSYDIDDSLRSKSAKDKARLQKLEAPYLDKIAKSAKKPKAKKSDWSAKLEKMRKDYPNAYKPWSETQDKTLLSLWADGLSIKKISSTLGRHQGSIKARLKKHFGDDIDFTNNKA